MSERQGQQGGWVWYGGRLCVDFVNTRKERYGPGRELLNSPGDLVAWMLAAHLTASPVTITDDQLRQARELREAIDVGIQATVAQAAFPAAATEALNSWLSRAGDYPPRLHLHNGVPQLQPTASPSDATAALYQVAHDAAELLGTDTRTRLRICQGTHCSARFVDHSAGQRRRWCQMTVCGNRAKATTHRHTTRPHSA